MASNTLKPRVALGSLNINIHSTVSPSNILKTGNAAAPTSNLGKHLGNVDQNTSPTKQHKIPASPTKPSPSNQRPDHLPEEHRLGGAKRRIEALDTSDSLPEPPQKMPGSARIKKANSIQSDSERVAAVAQGAAAGLVPRFACSMRAEVSPTRGSLEESASTSGPASPASSFESDGQSALNDSQNTVLTEPDSPITRVMAPEEIRQKARAMRLRLRLAAYKVSSNQIDIPISQLQIKTAPHSPKPPTLPPPPYRTPLPSAIPRIRFPESPTRQDLEEAIPSSPPQEASARKEPFATPLLPRQRQGLLNPPALDSPTWKDRELTSSAVKGKAADSLLSLMRQER